jgi:uncharacterized protein YndB with AHSA1/START domain
VPRNVVEATVRVAAPRQAVWDMLVDPRSWHEWGDWQSTEIEREGDPAPHGVGAVRRMVRRPLTIREQVELLEPPSRFGYTLLSGLPLRDYHAVVTLTDAGHDCTNLHWESRFDARWRALDAPMRKLVKATLEDVARKLAAEAERR